MTLLAAFKTLLYRITGQADLVVGVPVAGRTRPETERLIGFFVNTLAVRTDLSGDPTFREVLRRVRERRSRRSSTKSCPSRGSWRRSSRSAIQVARRSSK